MGRLNSFTVTGRLGKDPENKGKYTRCSIAEWAGDDKIDWWDFTSFEPLPGFKKGDKVEMTARLEWNNYNGEKRLNIISKKLIKTLEGNKPKKDDDFLEE